MKLTCEDLSNLRALLVERTILSSLYPVRYNPLRSVTFTVVQGTEAGVEFVVEVLPDVDSYVFKIPSFKLVTPPEVTANIILINLDGVETYLLDAPQDENQEKIYDASDWDQAFPVFVLRGFKLQITTKTQLTADRTVSLSFRSSYLRFKEGGGVVLG